MIQVIQIPHFNTFIGFLSDRQQIEQGLGGVLAHAITAVNYRNIRDAGGRCSCPSATTSRRNTAKS